MSSVQCMCIQWYEVRYMMNYHFLEGPPDQTVSRLLLGIFVLTGFPCGLGMHAKFADPRNLSTYR